MSVAQPPSMPLLGFGSPSPDKIESDLPDGLFGDFCV
jgi:hypothetical protein